VLRLNEAGEIRIIPRPGNKSQILVRAAQRSRSPEMPSSFAGSARRTPRPHREAREEEAR
jgi:hypothetical protein